ncbi:PQQ-binding-like beta-propeller repeat protein [Pendulispora albinea]|uniref:Uncharacterized protein n=1 Tax=Pendulispora albinea TaxID=2741071 RepID=A0ABZ2LXD1_9BACT
MSAAVAVVVVFFLLLGPLACGGALTRADLFSSESSTEDAEAIEAVRRRIARTRPATGVDIAVGVAGNGDRIVAVLLDDGHKWTYAHPLDARPAIAGQVIVGSGGGEIFCLDARTGNKLWVRPTGGLPLVGAGDDGRYTVVTLGRSGTARGSTLLAVDRFGDVNRQIETDESVGVPAVVGGLAFIPWGRKYISVFDIVAGNEPARIVFGERVSHAWTQGGSIYFGDAGVYRFDEHIQHAPNVMDATRERASHLMLPPRELPGAPVLLPPAEERPKLVATVRDRVRTYVRPGSSKPGAAPDEGVLTVASSRYYATYFRIIMGFDALRGRLAWVHTHASDIIGAAAAEGGFLTCDEQGQVTFLGARQGSTLGARELGEPVKSCVVQIDRLALPAERDRSAPSLASDLAEALRISDPELAAGKRPLIREIASLDDDIATKALIDASVDPTLDPFVVADVRAALASRRKGASYMLSALRAHYDFLKDAVKPPPVGPIARAFAAMNDASAAPLLTAHLLDPATPENDVQEAALALTTLARPSEAPALAQFFSLNYASAATPPIQSAVLSAAQILVEQGGKDGRAIVERAIASQMTAPDLRARLRALR